MWDTSFSCHKCGYYTQGTSLVYTCPRCGEGACSSNWDDNYSSSSNSSSSKDSGRPGCEEHSPFKASSIITKGKEELVLPVKACRCARVLKDGGLILTHHYTEYVGAIWAKIPTETFRSGSLLVEFVFLLTGTYDDAGGFAFVIQGQGEDAIGAKGSGLGYSGISNSVAVEFDDYNPKESNDGPRENHISIQSLGKSKNSSEHSASLACGKSIRNMPDCKPHEVAINILPDESDSKLFTLAVWMDDEFVCGARCLYDDIITSEGVWLGFTGATGVRSQENKIVNYHFYTLGSGNKRPAIVSGSEGDSSTCSSCDSSKSCEYTPSDISSPITTGKEELDISIGICGSTKWKKGYAVLTPDSSDCKGAMWTDIPTETFRSKSLLVEFDFLLSGSGHADGFAFVIQGQGSDALGEGGCGLGYSGITNSIAVEFDTYCSMDTADDPNDNHISIQSEGKDKNTSHHRASLACNSKIPTMSDGNPHKVAINILPDKSDSKMMTLAVWMDGDFVCGAKCLYDDIITSEGVVWLGFTAATGGLSQEHRIQNWFCYTVSE